MTVQLPAFTSRVKGVCTEILAVQNLVPYFQPGTGVVTTYTASCLMAVFRQNGAPVREDVVLLPNNCVKLPESIPTTEEVTVQYFY